MSIAGYDVSGKLKNALTKLCGDAWSSERQAMVLEKGNMAERTGRSYSGTGGGCSGE